MIFEAVEDWISDFWEKVWTVAHVLFSQLQKILPQFAWIRQISFKLIDFGILLTRIKFNFTVKNFLCDTIFL